MALYNTIEYWEGRQVTVVIWQGFTRRQLERQLFDVEPLGDKTFAWRAKVKVGNKLFEVKRARASRDRPLDAPDAWTTGI
jgi:hypothetical protein